jgi:hypothetical protein
MSTPTNLFQDAIQRINEMSVDEISIVRTAIIRDIETHNVILSRLR